MADSVEQSKWGKFLSETIIITSVGAVLYFWGRAYFDQLIRSSGFPSSLFEISLYDLLFSTWSIVALGLMYGLLLLTIWYGRYFYVMLLCWIGIAVFYFPVRLFLWLLPQPRLRRVVSPAFARIKRWLKWLSDRTPPDILEGVQRTKDTAITACGIGALAVFLIVCVGGYLESKAKQNFEAASADLSKRHISIQRQQGDAIVGQLVYSLGGNIIVDLPTSTDQLQRILVRSTDVKQVTLLPQPPPKEPSISAAPVTK